MGTSFKLGRVCPRCESPICDDNRSGICRKCRCREMRQMPNHRTPETEARRIAALVEANKRRKYLPWCPPEYHREYRNMIKNRRFKASEARAIILAQARADVAKLSPFERQMRALEKGGRITLVEQRPTLASPGYVEVMPDNFKNRALYANDSGKEQEGNGQEETEAA